MTQTIVPPEGLMTKRDVAAFLKCSMRQVELLTQKGRLPEPIRLGTHPRWRSESLVRFLESLGSEACGPNRKRASDFTMQKRSPTDQRSTGLPRYFTPSKGKQSMTTKHEPRTPIPQILISPELVRQMRRRREMIEALKKWDEARRGQKPSGRPHEN